MKNQQSIEPDFAKIARLKALIDALNVSQAEFGRIGETSATLVGNMLKGTRSITDNFAHAIERNYNKVNAAWLITGELDINGLKISCAVLEDGTRVVSERSVSDSIGAAASGTYWRKKKAGVGAIVPRYLYAPYLQPYISEELNTKISKSITYIAKNGTTAIGVEAVILPEICDVWIKAGQNGAIPFPSIGVAERAYQLLKGFANVGITALVDEATGYQYERERDELQKILKAYISPELLPWQQRFPNDFYVQLFRLNGWDYTTKGINKRPGVIGKWTKILVYEQLPKGVLQELEKTTPKNDSDRKKTAYFRQHCDCAKGFAFYT